MLRRLNIDLDDSNVIISLIYIIASPIMRRPMKPIGQFYGIWSIKI